MLLLWVLLVICVSCLSASYCLSVSGSLVDTCCERIDFLALLCLIFFYVLSLSHVSWVGCGTRLYGFQIFTFFITFIKKLSHKIITQPGSQKHIKVGDTKVYIQSVIGGNVIFIDVKLVVSSSHSVFTETGEIRVSKEKSKLRKCLKKEMSLWCIDKKKQQQKTTLFIFFYVLSWPPCIETVGDVVVKYRYYKTTKTHIVYRIFDRYREYSITTLTQASRGANSNLKTILYHGAVRRSVKNLQDIFLIFYRNVY